MLGMPSIVWPHWVGVSRNYGTRCSSSFLIETKFLSKTQIIEVRRHKVSVEAQLCKFGKFGKFCMVRLRLVGIRRSLG